MNNQKRAVAIHDISCIGKCSLTVALPILSAAGIETAVVPTAVLSTHTGGFSGYTYRDLTEDILPIANHWKTLNYEYDAFYTGYLGSFEQIDIVLKMIEMLKTDNTLVFVDPVMADHGQLYSSFSSDFPSGMKKLCEKADIIIPNITEATLLLGEEYKEGPYTEEYICGLLERLSEIGPKTVILTGVYFNEKKLGAAYYDRDAKKTDFAFAKYVKGFYHGTGDVFASALLGALLNGKDIEVSMQIAADFVVESIERTNRDPLSEKYGVNFERGLGQYAKSVVE